MENIKTYLARHNYQFEVCLTHKSGAQHLVTQLINNTSNDDKIILVIGGDGTLNQAVNGVKNSININRSLAYISAGSGNDFMNGLNIRNKDEIKMLQKILDMSKPLTVNIGHIKSDHLDSYFINNIGIGFDADIVHFANASKSKYLLNKFNLGTLSYLFQLTKVRQPGFSVTVKCGNHLETTNNVFLCTTSNHPYFGGGVPILPTANPYLNNLDVVLAKKMKLGHFLKLAYKVFTDGSHLQDKSVVRHYQFDQPFELLVNVPEYGQMDGEDLDKQKFKLEYTFDKQKFWI